MASARPPSPPLAAASTRPPPTQHPPTSTHRPIDSVWDTIEASIRGTALPKGAVSSAVVVGAGVAGLAAAGALHRAGVRVTVLEGRPRVGGRTHTDDDGFDHGAHWIHGGYPPPPPAPAHTPQATGGGDGGAGGVTPELNPLLTLCEWYGIETVLTDGDSTYIGESEGAGSKIAMHSSDGTALPREGPVVDELWNVWDRVMSAVHDRLHALEAEHPPNLALSTVIDAVLDSLEPPLTPRERRFANWHAECEFSGNYGDAPDLLSYFAYHDNYHDFTGGDRILVGGFGRLLERLQGDLEPETVQLNRVVTRIERHCEGAAAEGTRGVRVQCADGSETTADVAVITLPLGVLKRGVGESGHVEFAPPLPEGRLAAIDRGQMGCLNKLVLFFDACHWPPEQYSFGYINETDNEFPSMLINAWPTHGVAALCCMVGGAAGRAMELRTPDANTEWAMVLIRKLFGPAVPSPVRTVQTAWTSDPFSFGSYSTIGVRTHRGDTAILAEPVDGTLFFAGEATLPGMWGTAHGAIMTGRREAARVTGDMALLRVADPASPSLDDSLDVP